MKNAMILFIVLALGISSAAAIETAEVEALLQNKVDAALTILRRPDQDLAAKKRAIVTIVEPLFDFPLMAKLVLGKQHWMSLLPDEQQRFETLFIERLKSSYIDKIDLYSDEEVTWRPAQAEGANKVRISAVIISKEKEIVITYKLHSGSGSWKIYDVEVQGVSIVMTYRSQFNRVLTEGTKTDLFKELESPLQPAPSDPSGRRSVS